MIEDLSAEALSEAIPPHLAGKRLDQALAAMFPDYSRSRLKAWILEGRVDVDGQTLKPRDAVQAGAVVTVRPAVADVLESEPEAIELDVIYEDQDLLIVAKPAGLVVHPGAGNPRGTLMNGLLHYDAGLRQLPRAGIVHRLDKDTSGLLVVARSVAAHTALVRMLAQRQITREYLAVCHGVLTGGGTIDAPIGRHPVDRLRMHVTPGGRPAVTHYRVLERFAAHTWVQVRLETGRTHQIRVHFAYRRHPLVGDPVYGGRRGPPAGATPELRDTLQGFRRQALHAARLSLEHPLTGDIVDVSAPAPADFEALLAALREPS